MNDRLREAAQRRHNAAFEKASAAITELAVKGVPITFAAVARYGGVSTDFLYHELSIREKIEAYRDRPHAKHEPVESRDDSSTASSMRHLSAQLRKERAARRTEATDLTTALAAAHAENLRLRRLVRLSGTRVRPEAVRSTEGR